MINLDAKGQPLSDEVDCLPMDPEAGDQDPSLLVMENGQILLSSFSYYPLPSDIAPHVKGARTLGNSEDYFLFWGSHVSIREADSRTWRYHHLFLPPSRCPASDITKRRERIAGASRGQATEWSGKLWVPVYGEAAMRQRYTNQVTAKMALLRDYCVRLDGHNPISRACSLR